jgi:hypothetical protein
VSGGNLSQRNDFAGQKMVQVPITAGGTTLTPTYTAAAGDAGTIAFNKTVTSYTNACAFSQTATTIR